MNSSVKNKSLLPQTTAGLLRIVFEIMVLFHHLYQPSSEIGRRINSLLGPIAVAGFLIISGYGVGVSFLKKGDGYLSNLIKKRIPVTYITIVITNIFYLSFFFYTGDEFKSFFGFLTSVLYLPISKDYVTLSNWVYFMADLLIYYVLFFATMKILQKQKPKFIQKHKLPLTAGIMLALGAVVIVVLGIINKNTGSTRYLRACLCFPIGLLLANYDKFICNALKQYKRAIFLSLTVLGIIATGLSYNARLYSEYFANAFFALAVIVHAYGVEVKGKSVPFLSKHVLYVYLVHEWAFKMLRYINRDIHFLIDMVIVICVSAFIAFCLNYLKTLRQKHASILRPKLSNNSKS